MSLGSNYKDSILHITLKLWVMTIILNKKNEVLKAAAEKDSLVTLKSQKHLKRSNPSGLIFTKVTV